ncbi:MAG: VOC family protein [Burkholderiales bacterium]
MIHELFAYLCVRDTAKAIAFYSAAFGATEKFRLTEPSGRIGHAEMDFGGATLMLCDEFPEYNIKGPNDSSGTPVTIHLHVDNADVIIERAVQAGAKLEMAPADAFYGERSGVIRDPFGHRWNIGHSIEEVTPQEMQRRYTAMMEEQATPVANQGPEDVANTSNSAS